VVLLAGSLTFVWLGVGSYWYGSTFGKPNSSVSLSLTEKLPLPGFMPYKYYKVIKWQFNFTPAETRNAAGHYRENAMLQREVTGMENVLT